MLDSDFVSGRSDWIRPNELLQNTDQDPVKSLGSGSAALVITGKIIHT